MAYREEKSIAPFWAMLGFRCLLDTQGQRVGGRETSLECKGEVGAGDTTLSHQYIDNIQNFGMERDFPEKHNDGAQG